MDPLEKLAANPRVTVRRKGNADSDGDCVVYWMQRSQRGRQNAALNVAVLAANLLGKPVVVFFAPVPFYPGANLRHYAFLNQGIPDIADDLKGRNIGFVLRRYPEHSLIRFCEEVRPCLVVGDEDPLREPESWRQKGARELGVPLWTADAEVIVPSRLLLKEQYAAHIMRRRLHTHLPQFLVPMKDLRARHSWRKPKGGSSLAVASDITKGWRLDRSVEPIAGIKGGSRQAEKTLREFIRRRLADYPKQRNHPEVNGTSHLSPYLHFGHISALEVALAVQDSDAPKPAKETFLDQLITWRELSVNFVRFNPDYDNFESGEGWAHRTLAKHARDRRPVRYSERQLENAETYDPLWNAAQIQMVDRGWMHNYMRMYWAKKILEWSRTPAEAYRIAVYLNDKYEIDGRDPNGYAGIAWSIVGKFDRPWFERPIFGQVRYMSLASTGRKFDSKRYIGQNRRGK